MARSFKIPDLKDDKGRAVYGARIKARRCDTHAWLDEEVTTDEYGNATFSTLPDGVDVSLHATWGGTTTGLKERWFYSHINAVSEGGTGSSSAATARTNLGIGTGDSPQFEEINLGHASDTTLTRVSAALIAVEGDNLIRASDVDDTPVNGQTAVPVSSNWAFDHAADTTTHGTTGDIVGTSDTQTLTNKQMTTIELGHASDTTVARSAAGRATIEGVGVVRGPSSATDNAIARFNATTGDLIQDYTSNAPTISDTGDITVDGDTTADNFITGGNVDGRDVSADGTKLDNVVSNTQAITHAITDNKTVTVDGSPNDDEFARFTANGLEGRTASETLSDIGAAKMTLEVSTDDMFSEPTMGDTPFTAKIMGSPTATSVPYDTDTGDNSLNGGVSDGKLVLHNLTRSNSRLIEYVVEETDTIVTQSTSDDWADNDDITTQSQTNTQAGYVDLDLSGYVASTVTGIFLLTFWKDTVQIGEVVRFHPYEAYSLYKSVPLWNKTTNLYDTLMLPIPLISQRITFLTTASGPATGFVVLRYFGKFE